MFRSLAFRVKPSLAWALAAAVLMVALASVCMAAEQPDVTPALAARLAAAAAAPGLAPWQREYMSRLSGGAPAPAGLSAATPPVRPEAEAGGTGDGRWEELMPPVGRCKHTAIYDPVRGRMIVLGGNADSTSQRSDLWALSLTGNPVWTRLYPTGTPPDGRESHAAVYDPVRDRMLMVGGLVANKGCAIDVWALSLSGTPAWAQLSPTGTAPKTRYSFSLVYDSAHDRMVMYAGYDCMNRLGDVWTLSLGGTPAWTQLAPSGTAPPNRLDHAAVYDARRGRMVVFGGSSGLGYLNDVWALSLGASPAWTQLTPGGTSAPGVRSGAGAAYDSLDDCMLMVGGQDYSRQLGDVWALSLTGQTAWVKVTVPGPVQLVPRVYPTVIQDVAARRIVVYGGQDSAGTHHGEVRALQFPVALPWQTLGPSMAAPPGRCEGSALYDAAHRRTIAFAGQTDCCGPDNDVWVMTGTSVPSWTRLAPTGTGPTRAYGYEPIYDPLRNRMLVFGGTYYDTTYEFPNTVWALSLSGTPAWTQLAPTGTPPHGRTDGAVIYDPVRDRMVIFAGYYYDAGTSTNTYLNDVWALALSGTPAWTQLSPTGTPPEAREDLQGIYDPTGDRLLAYGGYVPSVGEPSSELWALSLSGTPAWTLVNPSGSGPGGRYGHASVYDPVRHRMLVFGGKDDGYQLVNSVWAVSLSGSPAWSQLAPGGTPPSSRYFSSAVYDSACDRLLVIGGEERIGPYEYIVDDVWSLWFPGAVGVDAAPRTAEVSFSAPRPNPSGGRVELSFALPRAAQVRLRLYDVTGRAVATPVDGPLGAGDHHATWDGRLASGARAAAGIYLCELRADGARLTRRVTLVR